LRVGKDRSTIANSLRLLNLPTEARDALIKKDISAGHARAILSVDSREKQITLLTEIIKKNSVSGKLKGWQDPLILTSKRKKGRKRYIHYRS